MKLVKQKYPGLKSGKKNVILNLLRTTKDKEIGSKKRTHAFYCEYVRRMFLVIEEMINCMKEGNEDYYPDIFKESSNVLKDLIGEYASEVPEYVSEFTYTDYFDDMMVGKHAIDAIKTAWQTEPKMFTVDKKKK